MLLIRVFTGLVLANCLLGNSVFADDLRSAAGKAVECRSIAEPLERLACLDAAAEDLSSNLENVQEPAPLATEEVIVAAPVLPEEPKAPTWAEAPESEPADIAQASDTTVAEEKRPLWARIIPGRSNRPKQANFIDVAVVRITRNNVGRHFFHTADDGVWRQLEPEELLPPGFLPAQATITRSTLGSPHLRFVDPDRRSYKVRRVE